MNITMKSNFKRLVTFLLIIVMVVGMLPATASASGPIVGGHGSKTVTTDVRNPGTGGGTPIPVISYARFTRYTLVRFNFSDNSKDAHTTDIPASQWMSGGTVIGSIDVITEEMNGGIPSNTLYLTSGSNLSNAFDYRDNNRSANIAGGSYLSLKNNKVFDKSDIALSNRLYAYPIHAEGHRDLGGYDNSYGDVLMSSFGKEYPGEIATSNVPLYAPNLAFNDVLKKIYDSSSNPAKSDLVDRSLYDETKFKVFDRLDVPNPVTAAETGVDCVYAYNFIDGAISDAGGASKCCYRLLAEPGVVMDAPYGSSNDFTPIAMTLRDMASVVLYQNNQITASPYDGSLSNVYQSGGTWAGILHSGIFRQFAFILNTYWYINCHAFGLTTEQNMFRTFTPDMDGDIIKGLTFNYASDPVFSFINNVHFIGFTSSFDWNAYNDHLHSMYSIAQYVLNDTTHAGNGTHYTYDWARGVDAVGINEYPSFGLGIIEPASMLSAIDGTPSKLKITIKKIIEGAEADMSAKYDFNVSIDETVYKKLTNDYDVTFSENEDGSSPVTFSQESSGNPFVYKIAGLGNNDSKTIWINIPDSGDESSVRSTFKCTIEELDAAGIIAAGYTISINNALDPDGTIENVAIGSTTTFKNQKGPPAEGNLHVIVDYNFPGAAATSDPDDPMNGNVLDCGIHPAGEVVDLTLVAGGKALSDPGSTKLEPVAGCTFTFQGLSVDPGSVVMQNGSNNGIILGNEGNVYHYQLPTDVGDEEELLILYVIWDIKVNNDPPPPPDIPDPVPGPTSNVYTVYWDLGSGFDGGGITSQTCGQIVIPALNLTATASCGCGSGTAHAQRAEIKIDFGFDPPTIYHNFEYYRLGHYFVGWVNTDMESEVYNYNKYVSDAKADGSKIKVKYHNNVLDAGSTMLMNGTQWLDHISDSPEAPGKSTTYCAVWVPAEYSFDSNGGYFVPNDDDDYPAEWYGQFPTCCGLSTELGLTKFTVGQSVGQTYHAYYIPRREPIRVGYTFTGWYWDPSCTIPVDRNEDGMMPGRVFFAGWDAEPVYVTYYDTREGNNVVTIQEYKYDDRIDLAEKMADTVGWKFDSWSKNMSDGFVDDTILDLDCLTAHENRYPDGEAGDDMSAGPNTGPNSNGAGAGVVSGKHYWTLDLYSLWNQEHAQYNVTINFNDYQNNDGARPTALTLGIVDSITNREVPEATIKVDLTGPNSTADQVTVQSNRVLPITVNDSSTERVKYYAYLKDYTDIDGNTYTVQNVEASTGEIEVASVSNADTSPVASYRYTLNRVNTGNVTDKPNTNGSPEYTGVMYFDHNLMTTGDDIEFTIRWNDDSDNDGMRPETLKLTLMGYGADNQWKPVQQWVSPGNQVHQSNSGVVYVNSGICDVSDDGNVWTYIFKDFQKYDKGNYIKYAVRVEGYREYSYTARDADENGNEDGIVLDYVPVTAPVPIDIHWHDNANQDGMRPSSVIVNLIAHQWNRNLGVYESVVVRSKLFTGFGATSNVWSSSFDNMPVYHDGEPIIYHLVVTSNLNGNMDDDSNPYTWSEGIAGNPYKDGARPSVDIYHNADERSVTATVQWDDNGNQDGKRPDSVTLQLYANNEPVPGDEYTVVLTGDPKALTWTYTFDHLDVYTDGRSGKEIIYKVKILDAQGGEFESYTPSYINKNGQFVETFGASGEAFVLMSYTPKTGTVSGAVYWQDDNNRDGQRPDFVTVALHASAFDNSTGEWIDYVAATKTVRSDEVNTMTADQWRFEFENMPVYRGSQPITYYITITSDLNGNTDDTALLYGWGEKDRGDMASDPELEVSVTVYQGVETISVTATVEWDDENNNDGLRPNAVQLQLYADNVRVAGEAYTVTLYGNPTEDTWTHTFEHLPRYASGASGKEINYTIYAAELKDYDLYGMYDEIGRDGTEYRFVKYEDWYPANDEGGLTNILSDSVDAYVTLVHKNNKIEVPFSIVWKDQNNRDAQRPDYVTVALMAYQWNGTLHTWEVTEKATATVPSDEINTMTADEWAGTFGEQEMYHDGIKVIYHLSVTSDLNAYIPEGSFEYGWVESAYGNQLDAVPQVTVSQNINTVTVPATVYWDDNGNNDGIRPTNIVLQLYAHEPGGTPVPVAGQAYRVNLTGDPKADNWNYTFSGMPKYAEGRSGVELIYTVQVIEAEGEPLYGYYIITANGEEEEVLRYEASYLYEDTEKGTTENTLDPAMSDRAYVRLSHISETQTMVFSANWHDSDDVDGVRPVNVSADLYKTVGDGVPV